MNDITKHWRFQRILREAAEYRALRRMLLEAARRPADAEMTLHDAGPVCGSGFRLD